MMIAIIELTVAIICYLANHILCVSVRITLMIWTSSLLVAGMPMLGWDEYVYSPVTFSCGIHGLPGFHK